MHTGVSKRMHEGVSERMHEGVNERMHEGLSERMHEGMSERMHEGLSERLYEWVRLNEWVSNWTIQCHTLIILINLTDLTANFEFSHFNLIDHLEISVGIMQSVSLSNNQFITLTIPLVRKKINLSTHYATIHQCINRLINNL